MNCKLQVPLIVIIEKTTGKLGVSDVWPVAKKREAHFSENFPLGNSGGAMFVMFKIVGLTEVELHSSLDARWTPAAIRSRNSAMSLAAFSQKPAVGMADVSQTIWPMYTPGEVELKGGSQNLRVEMSEYSLGNALLYSIKTSVTG